MEIQSYDSRVINGVRIYRVILWDRHTRTKRCLHASSQKQLNSWLNELSIHHELPQKRCHIV